MQDTKAWREVEVLQQFYAMLSNDSARAFYGPGHIRAAQELGAIATLLITDTVLLVHDVNKVTSVPDPLCFTKSEISISRFLQRRDSVPMQVAAIPIEQMKWNEWLLTIDCLVLVLI